MEISLDDFKKLDIRVGFIVLAERVENTDKLLKLMIDIGEPAPRQVLSGIAEYYEPADLVGRQVCVLANLTPRVMRGLESAGMILAAGADRPILLQPAEPAPPGSSVR